jgi:hypothetical protein
MRVRENLGGIINNLGRNNFSSKNSLLKVGKVYGIVTTENTPTKKQFERAGGFSGVGKIFYKEFQGSINISGSQLDSFYDGCLIASPLTPSTHPPLIGECVVLYNGLPSFASENSSNALQTYYGETINIFNNSHHNSISPSGNLGKTFIEKYDKQDLLRFEGDIIYPGRNGNGIRFGSTIKSQSSINEWSNVGKDGDPITILVNGYVTMDTGSSYNIEEINKEMSSIYMTSTQTIPLIPGTSIVNPINSSLEPSKYIDSQVILNSDRITINSKKDEVLIFSKTDTEISANNIINLNANNLIHLNIESKNPDSKILLGTKANNTVPDEPVLLGGQTHDLLLEMCNTLRRLAGYLANANAVSSDGAIPVIAVQDGADQLLNDVNNLINKLGTIQSDKVFTV